MWFEIFGKILGWVMDFFEAEYNNDLATQRESLARKENFSYNEQSADNADTRTRALYNDLQSPASLVQQYKDAGLSPSMMFGGSVGGQPTTGAQGQGAGGVNPTTFGLNLNENANQIADTHLKEAEARKANVEADTMEGKNERGENEIKKLVGEVEYQYLANEAVQWENSKRAMEVNLFASYAEDEQKAKISMYQETANNLYEQTREQRVKGNISEKTEEKVIKMIDQDLRQKIANVALTKIQTKLTEKQIKLTEKQINALVQSTADNHHLIMVKDEEVYINYRQTQQHIQNELKKLGIEEEKLRWEVSKMIFDEIISTGNLLTDKKPKRQK